jgi:hypothetical protein
MANRPLKRKAPVICSSLAPRGFASQDGFEEARIVARLLVERHASRVARAEGVS